MQTLSVIDKARNSLTHIGARYSGETGFPARDFPILQQCTSNILAALDQAQAAAARVTELEAKLAEFEANLKERDDRYAVLTGKIDQLKAEIESSKRDAISDVVSSTYTPEVHEKFRDAAALVADANEYAKQDCVHPQ